MAKIASLALLHVALAADTVVLQTEDYNVNVGDLSSGEAKHIVINELEAAEADARKFKERVSLMLSRSSRSFLQTPAKYPTINLHSIATPVAEAKVDDIVSAAKKVLMQDVTPPATLSTVADPSIMSAAAGPAAAAMNAAVLMLGKNTHRALLERGSKPIVEVRLNGGMENPFKAVLAQFAAARKEREAQYLSTIKKTVESELQRTSMLLKHSSSMMMEKPVGAIRVKLGKIAEASQTDLEFLAQAEKDFNRKEEESLQAAIHDLQYAASLVASKRSAKSFMQQTEQPFEIKIASGSTFPSFAGAVEDLSRERQLSRKRVQEGARKAFADFFVAQRKMIA